MTTATHPAGHWGRRFAAALLPLLLAACGTPDPAPKAKPAMWLVEDADTRIYLLGTMHALPPGTDWDDGAVGQAIASADELMMELSPRELAAAGEMFQKLAPRTAPLAIEARLSGTGARPLPRAGSDSGGSFGGDKLDDWAVMILIGQRAARAADLSPRGGGRKRTDRQYSGGGQTDSRAGIGAEPADAVRNSRRPDPARAADPRRRQARTMRLARSPRSPPRGAAAMSRRWKR